MKQLVTQIRVTLSALALGCVLSSLPGLARAQPDVDEEEDAPDPPSEPDVPKPTPAPEPDAAADADPEPAPPAPNGSKGTTAKVSGDTGADTATRNDTGKDGGGDKDDAAAKKDQPLVDGAFHFGSYGRVVAATDVRGRPGRNVDIVGWGSRFDHSNYVELELRREDHWYPVDADTRVVATVALGHPIFHYDGEFDAQLAVRNLFIEEKGLGLKRLSFWAGSRMLRGDDIYVLDFWPLDNLNTLGAGLQYDAETKTSVQFHAGMSQPQNPFYKQEVLRPAPLNQFGAATVDILDRQKWIGSLRAEQIVGLGEKAGLKLVAYGEAHQVPAGERETARDNVFEAVPHDDGWLVGAQVSAYTGERDTHVNLYVRYATGVAAYGAFAHPDGLGPDETTSGARELLAAAGGNWEIGPFAMMLGAYFRSFRNASENLDFGDLDEGIVLLRPQVWFADWVGLAVEGSFQGQQRGTLSRPDAEGTTDVAPEPQLARIGRVGVMPFITPAGRGSYKRPMFFINYMASFRDAGARALYPVDDVFRVREIDHFIGFGAEWWFSSTSYFRGQ